MKLLNIVFTNQNPRYELDLGLADNLILRKFVLLNDLDFTVSPSLELKISLCEKSVKIDEFIQLLDSKQKDLKVVDLNKTFSPGRPCSVVVEIVNKNPLREFKIGMTGIKKETNQNLI